MNDAGKSPLNRSHERGPPTIAVAAVLAIIGLACILGYFLLMKLVQISKDEDCLLAHGRDCGRIEIPR
jgi:hypothetical protein